MRPLPRFVLGWLGLGAIGGAVIKGGSQSAHAYNDYATLPCKRAYVENQGNLLTIYYYVTAGDSIIYSAYQTSISDWNLSDTPVNYVAVSSNWDVFMYDFYDQNDPYLGHTSHKDVNTVCSGGLHGLNVFVNRYTLYRDWNSDFNFIRSTTGHEEGHAIGLGRSLYSPAIMNPDEDTYSPRTDDVCGVNALYPSNYWPRNTAC